MAFSTKQSTPVTFDEPPEEGSCKHLAIIMDGNRRWASNNGLPGFAGHRAGVDALKKLVRLCPDRNIKYLSVFVFSTENWKRKKNEVDFLMELFSSVLESELKALHEQGVRIRFIGDKENLEKSIAYQMQQASQLTQNNSSLNLQIAFNYSGRAEIISAVQKMLSQIQSGEISPKELEAAISSPENLKTLFVQNLDSFEIPEPDLLIRTGGEQRISNFLLWEIAYSEIIFSKTLWPDFAETDLDSCLQEFKSRNRRFGK